MPCFWFGVFKKKKKQNEKRERDQLTQLKRGINRRRVGKNIRENKTKEKRRTIFVLLLFVGGTEKKN